MEAGGSTQGGGQKERGGRERAKEGHRGDLPSLSEAAMRNRTGAGDEERKDRARRKRHDEGTWYGSVKIVGGE